MNIVCHPIENDEHEILHGVDQTKYIFKDEKVNYCSSCILVRGF